MTEEQKNTAKATYLANLGCIAADVSNTLFMESECALNKLMKSHSGKTKYRIKCAKQSIAKAKKDVAYLAEGMYHCEDTWLIAEDSDYLRDMILLIADRTFGDGDKKGVREKIKEIAPIHNFKDFMDDYQ